MTDYREELVLNLSSARALAAKTISKAQQNQRVQYDRHTSSSKLRVGDWILIYFPQDETGKHRKLSRPWHGPYRIISRNDPDVTAVKIFFPTNAPIQVHQSRVNKCPPSFPNDFYWYGGGRSKPGRPTKKIQEQLEAIDAEMRQSSHNIVSKEGNDQEDQTESAITVGTLPEHPTNSDAAVSASPTLDIAQSSNSHDVITSEKKGRSSTKPTDQPKYEHSQQPKCPYSLRSRRQEDGQIDHIQETRDEFNQRGR